MITHKRKFKEIDEVIDDLNTFNDQSLFVLSISLVPNYTYNIDRYTEIVVHLKRVLILTGSVHL